MVGFWECFGNIRNPTVPERRKLLLELVGRAGIEPATNGLKDRVPIGPKYLTTMLLRRLDCGKQLPTTGRKSTALLRAWRDFPHIRHCPREAASERETSCRDTLVRTLPLLQCVRATDEQQMVYLHPQAACDALTVAEFGRKFYDVWRAGPG